MADYFTQRAAQILTDANGGVRLDANELAFVERELTQLRTTVYSVEYPQNLARSFLPMNSDVAPSAETFVYIVTDRQGKAKIIANDADDLPSVEVTGKEVLGKTYAIGASFSYGLNELRESARIGRNLSVLKARAARDAIEDAIDNMLAFGNTGSAGETTGVTAGFVNNADVAGNANARVQNLGNWSGTSEADDVYGEINGMIAKMMNDSHGVEVPTDLVLPIKQFTIASTLRLGLESSDTVLAAVKRNNPFIQRVSMWSKLDGYGTASNGRAILYKKDPLVLEGYVPQEVEVLPPEARNLRFVCPVIARCGGVATYRPGGVLYGDFSNS